MMDLAKDSHCGGVVRDALEIEEIETGHGIKSRAGLPRIYANLLTLGACLKSSIGLTNRPFIVAQLRSRT